VAKPDFDAVRDKRMSELSFEQQQDALELWLREHVAKMPRYHRDHYEFLFHRLDVARNERNALAARRCEPREAKAWLFRNVQSGDTKASTNPDWNESEREIWHREPLFGREIVEHAKSADRAQAVVTHNVVVAAMRKHYGGDSWTSAQFMQMRETLEAAFKEMRR
jgi:hypothetical protein